MMFAQANSTRFGITTVTGVAALVLAPSLTVVPSVYEVLRQSMSNGRATSSVTRRSAQTLNTESVLPLVICKFWKVVKPI